MTFIQTLTYHQILWDIISELCADEDAHEKYCDVDDLKWCAFHQMGLDPDDYEFGCFCCQYTGYNHDDAHRCDCQKCMKCPVDWGIDETNFGWTSPPCCYSLYEDFINEISDGCFIEAASIAKDIADLPINPIYREEEE